MKSSIKSNSNRRRHDERVPPNDDAARITVRQRYQMLALAALTLALVGLCVLLAVPFLPALTWGVALAIMAWPLHTWVNRHIRRPNAAAAVSTTVVVVLILAPGLFVAYQLAREATSAVEQVQRESIAGTLRDRMARAPILG